MSQIVTVQHTSTIIDDDITTRFPLLFHYKWQLSAGGYVIVGGHRLHMIIAGTPAGMVTHHIDGDKLNNLRSNLLCMTAYDHRQLHQLMAPPATNTGYKGVYWVDERKKYKAYIKSPTVHYQHLGYYSDVIEAAKAYDTACNQYYGHVPSRYVNLPA